MRSKATEASDLTRRALSELGVGPHTLTADERRNLEDDGFVVLTDVLDEPSLAGVYERIEQGLATARHDPTWPPSGTLHLDGLFDAGPDLDRTWTAPRLLAAVAHLLGDELQARGLHFRGPLPGFGAQLLHQDFGRLNPDDPVTGAIAIVALSTFTADNGATRVVRGSHRTWGFSAPSTMDTRHPDEEAVLLSAGSALVLSGQLWHSGVRNRSAGRRDALQIRFARRGTDTEFYPDVSSATLDRLGSAAYLLL